ncbi:MAG: hypothetical protein FJ014_16045 [Chloroflexi bacterium]|nr:hypothetical protein [Chloroflexota bacterium]
MFKLGDFDQQVIQKWRITKRDLENVQRYVTKLQKHLAHSSLDDITIGGIYGTSALIHEVMELRILLERDPDLLRLHYPKEVEVRQAEEWLASFKRRQR